MSNLLSLYTCGYNKCLFDFMLPYNSDSPNCGSAISDSFGCGPKCEIRYELTDTCAIKKWFMCRSVRSFIDGDFFTNVIFLEVHSPDVWITPYMIHSRSRKLDVLQQRYWIKMHESREQWFIHLGSEPLRKSHWESRPWTKNTQRQIVTSDKNYRTSKTRWRYWWPGWWTQWPPCSSI